MIDGDILSVCSITLVIYTLLTTRVNPKAEVVTMEDVSDWITWNAWEGMK